jgi:hypothetical protein
VNDEGYDPDADEQHGKKVGWQSSDRVKVSKRDVYLGKSAYSTDSLGASDVSWAEIVSFPGRKYMLCAATDRCCV